MSVELADLFFEVNEDGDVDAFLEGAGVLGSTTLANAIMQAEELWHYLREQARLAHEQDA